MTHSSLQDSSEPALPLEVVISELTEHERSKIDEAVTRIVKASSTLAQSCISELAAYWDTEAASARNTATAIASATSCDTPRDSASYCAIKDAVVQTLIFEKVVSNLVVITKEDENTFNRKVGESIEEYKTRINRYLNELDK